MGWFFNKNMVYFDEIDWVMKNIQIFIILFLISLVYVPLCVSDPNTPSPTTPESPSVDVSTPSIPTQITPVTSFTIPQINTTRGSDIQINYGPLSYTAPEYNFNVNTPDISSTQNINTQTTTYQYNQDLSEEELFKKDPKDSLKELLGDEYKIE